MDAEDHSEDNRVYLADKQHNTHQGNPFNPLNPGSDNIRSITLMGAEDNREDHCYTLLVTP